MTGQRLARRRLPEVSKSYVSCSSFCNVIDQHANHCRCSVQILWPLCWHSSASVCAANTQPILDHHDTRVAQQLVKQKAEEEEYAKQPFEPKLSAASLADTVVTLADPLSAKGKTIFEGQSCNACPWRRGRRDGSSSAAHWYRKTLVPRTAQQFV
jgi:hypothetical protein